LVAYPERTLAAESIFQRMVVAAEATLVAQATRWRARRLASIVPLVAQAGESVAALEDAELAGAARSVGAALRRERHWPALLVAQCFAIIREASLRCLGHRHYDV
jgi:preprotein translocase subunit SecA